MIPNHLQNPALRFCLVRPNEKGAFEEDWQNARNYMHSDSRLIKHIQTGGNYGVIGGPGGLALLDVDIMNKEFLSLIESIGKTFCVETGSGKRHYYFICLNSGNIDFNNNGRHYGEFRAKNRYVVGPGCTHPSGNKYKVIVDSPIMTIDFGRIKEIFKDYLPPKTEEVPIPEGPGKPLEDLEILRKRNKKFNDLLNGDWKKYKYPSRSEAEFACVGFLKGIGFNKQQIDYIMTNISKIGKWGDAHKQYGEITTKKASEIDFNKFFNKKHEFVPKYLGDEIMKNVFFKTLKGSDKIYRYHNGVYKEDGKELIKRMCVKYLEENFRTNYVNETITYIQSSTYIDPNEVNNEWINLENGLLKPMTGEFKMHTPKIFSIIRIPIIYDPKAGGPTFIEKIKEKLNEESIEIVQEMFGYCYLPKQKYEVAFLLYGPRRTMKSTTLFVLEKMLGDENVSAFPLQYLTENQFASAYLYGISANICADLSSRGLKDTGMFMSITGGDKISIAKKHEHPFSFYPSSKLIFSCNTIPPTTNKNLAFYRRWIILPFNKQTPKEEIDPELREKLIKELPGILNWSLEGLKRLLKNNRFSYWLDEDGVKDLYEKSSDTIQSFIYNNINCELDEGSLTKRVVYKEYLNYCKTNRLAPENVIKFGRWFKEHTGCGICKKGTIPAYSGVSFKSKDNDKCDEDLRAFDSG